MSRSRVQIPEPLQVPIPHLTQGALVLECGIAMGHSHHSGFDGLAHRGLSQTLVVPVPQRQMITSCPLSPVNWTLFGYRIFACTVSSSEVVQEGGGWAAVNDLCVLVTDTRGGSLVQPGQALSDVAARAGMPGGPRPGRGRRDPLLEPKKVAWPRHTRIWGTWPQNGRISPGGFRPRPHAGLCDSCPRDCMQGRGLSAYKRYPLPGMDPLPPALPPAGTTQQREEPGDSRGAI